MFTYWLATFLFVVSIEADGFEDSLSSQRWHQRIRSDESRTTGGNLQNFTFYPPMNVDLPDAIDWRNYGFVTPVQTQGSCDSCWAFTTAGVLEGQFRRYKQQLLSFSAQNLVDCSTFLGNRGCQGGHVISSYDYVRIFGIELASDYPYVGQDQSCRAGGRIATSISGYYSLPPGDEEALKAAVATQGPISVAIDSNHSSFTHYTNGVYYEPECNPADLDHYVLLTGYGTDPEEGDFWVVKNSWGVGWGEFGFARIARNKGNHCGIASMATYQ